MEKINQYTSTSSTTNTEFKLLKILIVDDNCTISMVLRELMKEYGSEILISGSGEEAIKIVKNNPDIDLIMMDTYMPRMNGSEATNRIRQFNTEVVIIIVTVFPLSEIIEEFAGVVFDDYLPKPFSKFKINQLIIKYFKDKNRFI